MPLSICIAGCGNYARRVLDEIHDMRETVTLYFASRDGARARQYNDTYGGAGFFTSYEEAARDHRVEAMYLFFPHHLHLEGTRLAASHSKHVLVEKPIARTIPEASELIAAARDAGVVLMVAENYRFAYAVDKCKELMAEGLIGDTRLIQVQREGNTGIPEGWRRNAEINGGGAMIDAGIHDVDALVNIGGFPESVYAAIPPRVAADGEGEDGIAMTARFPGGAVGLLNFSWGTPVQEARDFLHVTGTRGEIRFQPFATELVLETPASRRSFRLPPARWGVRPMIEEFVAAVRQGREPVMSGREGLKDLAVVVAAYESARTGLPVAPELA